MLEDVVSILVWNEHLTLLNEFCDQNSPFLLVSELETSLDNAAALAMLGVINAPGYQDLKHKEAKMAGEFNQTLLDYMVTMVVLPLVILTIMSPSSLVPLIASVNFTIALE